MHRRWFGASKPHWRELESIPYTNTQLALNQQISEKLTTCTLATRTIPLLESMDSWLESTASVTANPKMGWTPSPPSSGLKRGERGEGEKGLPETHLSTLYHVCG